MPKAGRFKSSIFLVKPGGSFVSSSIIRGNLLGLHEIRNPFFRKKRVSNLAASFHSKVNHPPKAGIRIRSIVPRKTLFLEFPAKEEPFYPLKILSKRKYYKNLARDMMR
ncbi:MAG: hypothetical protein AB1797_12865 [bacterium]